MDLSRVARRPRRTALRRMSRPAFRWHGPTPLVVRHTSARSTLTWSDQISRMSEVTRRNGWTMRPWRGSTRKGEPQPSRGLEPWSFFNRQTKTLSLDSMDMSALWQERTRIPGDKNGSASRARTIVLWTARSRTSTKADASHASYHPSRRPQNQGLYLR